MPKEKITPFAMRFQEKIPEEDTIPVGGKYNEKNRMWEWPSDPNDPSLVMSFPRPERPPTFCITPTRIDPRRTAADTEHDD